jgi:hypothetical protein
MAGTVTPTQRLTNYLGQNPQVQRTQINWTSDSGGSASGSVTIEGVILRVVFDPSGSPTDAYDVTLSDANQIDVLAGLGANRSGTDPQSVVPVDTTSGLPFAVAGNLALSVANAGNAKTGKVVIYSR